MKHQFPTLFIVSLLLMAGYNDTPVVDEESAGTQQTFTLSAYMPGSDGLYALWERTSFVGEADVQAYKITMTTSKKILDKISLWIDAAEEDQSDVWIDLNNNGTKEDGEGVTEFEEYNNYTIVSQTVTLYGKVTGLDCSNNSLTALDVSNNKALTKLLCYSNSLTALDVSKNTKLTSLSCFNNEIGVKAMDILVNSLPNRNGKSNGYFRVINISNPAEEKNVCTKNHVETASGKNWKVESCRYVPYKGS